MTTWAPLPAWPLYDVSDTGLVRRSLHAPHRGPAVPGRLLRPKARQRDGRLEVCLYDGTKAGRRVIKVHLLVAAAFLPPRPDEEHDVDHINRVYTDNAASNLRWLHYSINRSSRLMDELFGPARTDWTTWELDSIA